MTPAARCQSGIELLDQIEAGDGPADALLSAWFRSHRFAGSHDRAAIQALVYAVLRRRGQLDWWCGRQGIAPTSRARVIAALALAAPWPDGEAAIAFAETRYGPSPQDDDERRLAEALGGAALDHPDQPPAVRVNVPAWLEPLFSSVFNDRFDIELNSLVAEASVDLRVNTLRINREALTVRLAAEGIEATATPWSPVGLRLARRRPLGGSAAAREGLFEPQDEGSQVVALMAGARPGQAVLDLCAGGGGKALALAAAMEDRGRLVLTDIDPNRLARARPRLERAGVGIAETVDPADLETDAFDIVLIDAPCSGSGAWRRNPEAKWRLTPARLAELTALQSDLLARGAHLVRPGGRLVYVTCSLLGEENRSRVDAFLAAAAGRFRLIPPAADWRRVCGRDLADPGDDLLLTPARHGTDGFYLAILERVG